MWKRSMPATGFSRNCGFTWLQKADCQDDGSLVQPNAALGDYAGTRYAHQAAAGGPRGGRLSSLRPDCEGNDLETGPKQHE